MIHFQGAPPQWWSPFEKDQSLSLRKRLFALGFETPGCLLLTDPAVCSHRLHREPTLCHPWPLTAARILVELAHRGMQALHLQHRSPSSYRVKARASYVDETLFGSPTGTRPTPPAFDPPWVQNCDRSRGVGPGPPKVSLVKRDCESTPSRGSTPNLTPRKRNKYR